MNPTMNRFARMVATVALALAGSHALAQAPANKPRTAKPAVAEPAKHKTRAKADKIMTRDQLRACMQLKDANAGHATDLEQRRVQMSKERKDLLEGENGADAARAEAEKHLEAVKQADALVREHGKAIQDWNDRMAEFEKHAKEMRNADRRRQVFKQERIALTNTDEKLVADRTAAVETYERVVKKINDQIAERAARNDDWNKRNEQLDAAEDQLTESREKYAAECSNRRFREDDELAIKAGK